MAEKSKRIDKFCAETGINFDALNTSTQKRLLQAASVFDGVGEAFLKAQQTLSGHSLSIAALSQALGVSRSAIYKNDILLSFIEKNANELRSKFLSESKDAEISALRGRIAMLEKHDAEIVRLRNRVAILEDDLAHAHDATEQNLLLKYRSLQKENEALKNENLELYRQLHRETSENIS